MTQNEFNSLYKKWSKLVNMSYKDLKFFMTTEQGKLAGLSKQKASSLGIKSGQESARRILKMKLKKYWDESDIKWAKRQISFISRMKGVRGPLVKNESLTRKATSLLIWGHDPTQGKWKKYV